MLFKIDVLKNFAIFRGKKPVLDFFFLIKLHVYNFPVNLEKILRTAFPKTLPVIDAQAGAGR